MGCAKFAHGLKFANFQYLLSASSAKDLPANAWLAWMVQDGFDFL
jgi:hypothetical protein